MPLDLTRVKDHPSRVLDRITYDGPKGESETQTQFALRLVRAANIEEAATALASYEGEHNVTFAALDNDALAAVREAYAAGEDATGIVDVSTAHQALRDAVNALLGLDD